MSLPERGGDRGGEGSEVTQGWYRQVVERSPGPIFLTDAGGQFRAWNGAAELLLGGSLAGRAVASVLSRAEGAGLGELMDRVRAGETLEDVELTHTAEDGRQRTFHMCVLPALLSETGTEADGLIFSGVDVTDRVRFEADLVRARDAAEAAVKLKSTILNNLSHEIRTPLTAILGFTELLYEEVPESFQEIVHLIRISGKRLMGTLVAVLELARLESGDVQFILEEVDLREEIEEVRRMFAPQAGGKGLELELALPEQVPPLLMDRVALNRILSNLISNAIKFTSSGAVAIELRLDETHAHLFVKDSGIGIGHEFLPHIFEEFKQESEGLGRQHEGAGLGLAITKRLVEQMGGAIEVESEQGVGTTFAVRRPRLEVTPPGLTDGVS